MEKTEPLKENRDFKRIYQRGKSRVHALLVTYAMKNRKGISRVGIVSSKKIGNAVKRNRARRVVRAAFRASGITIPAGWDVIFVCRARTTVVKSTALVPVVRQTELLFSPGKNGN